MQRRRYSSLSTVCAVRQDSQHSRLKVNSKEVTSIDHLMDGGASEQRFHGRYPHEWNILVAEKSAFHIGLTCTQG